MSRHSKNGVIEGGCGHVRRGSFELDFRLPSIVNGSKQRFVGDGRSCRTSRHWQ